MVYNTTLIKRESGCIQILRLYGLISSDSGHQEISLVSGSAWSMGWPDKKDQPSEEIYIPNVSDVLHLDSLIA